MKKSVVISVILLAVLALTSCSSAEMPNVQLGASETPCIDAPELTAAVETVFSAKSGEAHENVYGESGGGSSNLMELLERSDLAAMQNPKGQGVLVTIVYPSGPAFARQTAMRTGWLVLDNVLYPINVEAAQTFSLLWDGYPEDVKRLAGIESNDFGLDSYGLDEIVAFNEDTYSKFELFLNQANQLCTPVTEWG